MKNILDFLLDAVCVVNEDGIFLSADGAVERIFGYTVDEMIGQQMLDLVHPDDRDRTVQAVSRLMAGELQYEFENRYIRKDGTVVHLMWAARWYPDQGIRVAAARDISARNLRQGGQSAPVWLPDSLVLKRWRLLSSPPQLVAPNGRILKLSGQDYSVLKSIAEPKRVVSRREIIETLGHAYLDYDQRRLDSQMRRLRRKVEAETGLELPITTLRGVGFRFYEDIEVVP